MRSAAPCDATDSVAVAFTTASTSDAAPAASEALKLPATEALLSEVSNALCATLAVLASMLAKLVATATASMLLAEFSGAGAATTGADTATPVQAVRPELCSAATNDAGLTAEMLDARPLAADAEPVTTLKATVTLPAAARWRRPGASVAPVTDTAEGATERTLAIAVVNAPRAAPSNVVLA